MFWNPFKKISNDCLGVDIGTSSIKIVEIRKKGKEKALRNYGEIKVNDVYPGFKRSIILAESEEIATLLQAILRETKVKTRTAVFSLPDYSSFFTSFTLPAMSKEEIPEAVRFETPIHIPLPSSKVTLDWQVVGGPKKENQPIKILVVAVPNEIIDKYRKVASGAQLNLIALEAEVFGLIRALVKTEETVVLVDIGRESTTCSIVDKKILKLSHSFDISGKRLTEELVKNLNIEHKKAERIKKENGILGEKAVRECLTPVLDLILNEIKQICNDFFKKERKEVENLILAGGSALLPGLKEYFTEKLNVKVEIADPFLGLTSPPILTETLKKMSPLYAISVGMALRGLK